ncbi:MAG TPA: c-type cytochrome domain-containing protein [Candidatus Polarisedimenticolia bacterium]|nr:c-type cytochrome domain-containing protein [Candidatus Polarisedimenticolia bacterium]
MTCIVAPLKAARTASRHGGIPTRLLVSLCAWIFLSTFRLLAADTNIDESKLPPVATNHIDFTRDIKPIFDASCIRCHGPVKPKSGFRLDSRATALKGGDNGVDIIPGNSAKSPIIHFTANLVEDMEMPPPGKGTSLTDQQVALLRAWIDQGAPWGNAALSNSYAVSLSPTIGGTVVSGDNHKFRELEWRKERLDGGLDDSYIFKQINPDTTSLLESHALKDDYKIKLSLDRNNLGFIHSGWEQFRKYYDDTGGYRPEATTPNALSLDQDLHLDIGKAWIDFGLTLPRWPRMVLGYEYDYRRGNEASTSWSLAGSGPDARNLAPASKSIDEGTHIIKFDLNAEVKGVSIEDRFRGDFYSLNTHYTNTSVRGPVSQNVREHDTYFQGANSIMLEKQFTDWLYCSAGYLYSHLDADNSFTNLTQFFTLSFAGSVPNITLERESHVANVNGIIGPFEGLTFSGGAQTEWTDQHGFGAGNLNQFPFTRTAPNTLVIVPTTLSADYDERSAMENLALRYTKIPFTILFAEGRLEQQSIAQNDSDLQPSGNYIENVDFASQLTDFRAGFSTSPWRWMSLSAHYRRYENDSRYPTNQPAEPAGGYPGFFRSRDLITDEFETKLVVRPSVWLKTTLSCDLQSTDFRDSANAGAIGTTVFSPAGTLLTGHSETETYTIGAVLTPHPRFYLSGSFSYQPSTTRTANNSVATVGPYRGDTYSADTSATFVLSQTMDLYVGWVFSEANFGQDKARLLAPTGTVPVDIRYQEHSIQAGLTRRFSKNLAGRLQYSFDYYREPSSGDANDFRAHTVFATLNLRLP